MDLLAFLDGTSSESEEDIETNSAQAGQCAQTLEEPPAAKKQKVKGSIEIVPQNQAPPDLFVRSVNHRRGHWSGHIFIPVDDRCFSQDSMTKSIHTFRRKLEQQGYSGILMQHNHVHLSLSKYFSMQIGFIDSFVQHLTERLRQECCTKLFVDKTGGVMVNEEKTRSFWGWQVRSCPTLIRIVKHVDAILAKYKQPSYYDPPQFHVSLASISGDVGALASGEESDESDDACDQQYLPVTTIMCNFGTTKTYTIRLQR